MSASVKTVADGKFQAQCVPCAWPGQKKTDEEKARLQGVAHNRKYHPPVIRRDPETPRHPTTLRSGHRDAATFARDNGWDVGDTVRGTAIVCDGVQVERPREAVITAIGQENVLGISRSKGETVWGAERTLGFNARDWTLHRKA